MLDASPDIRAQIQSNAQLHTESLRDSPIKSILLTNGDIDHIAGLLTLREKQPLKIFLTRDILKIIAANSIFSALDPGLTTFCEANLETPFEPVPGLEAEFFSVPGKTPLFMEDGNVVTDAEGGQTVASALKRTACAWYISGCARMSEYLESRLRNQTLVFFDGTLFDDDELQKAGISQKTGFRMGHMAMNGPEGSIASFDGLNVERKIYVHVNNTNPVWRTDSPERAIAEKAGWEIAYDGMKIVL